MWDCDADLKNCNINKWIGPIIPEQSFIFKPLISHFKTFLKQAYNKTSGFDLNQKKAVDKDIIYKLEEKAKFKFIDVPLYYYRHHESGISQGKSEFQARIYQYIAKCKAYRRRLNTNIPNVSLNYLYSEYYKITFHSLIIYGRFIIRAFKISKLKQKIQNNCSNIINRLYKKLMLLEKISRFKLNK